MQEIKCPKCGEVFQVDESGYAAIVRQVRDKEFEKELSERKAQYLSEKENAVLLAQTQTRQVDPTGRDRRAAGSPHGGNFPAAGKACGSREHTAAGRGRRPFPAGKAFV